MGREEKGRRAIKVEFCALCWGMGYRGMGYRGSVLHRFQLLVT